MKARAAAIPSRARALDSEKRMGSMESMTNSTSHRWRGMVAQDLDAVHALAKRVHAAYPERPEVAQERMRLAPGWCRVLETTGAIAGYVVAHPWRLFAPPPLDTLLGAPAARPDTLYLHDIVIAPERRGAGDARAALAALFADARAAFPTASLVSVAGLEPFWRRWGFETREGAGLPAILATYDPDARYMVRDFSAP